MSEASELEARLAKARAAREAIDSAALERRNLELLRLEVEAAERAVVEAEAISALEETHGPIGRVIDVVATREGAVVVRRPEAITFRKFQDKASFKTVDLEAFVRPCLLYPSREAFDRLCEVVPAALTLAANAVARLGGMGQEEIAGK